jgi:glycogen(starch) synthase
MLLLFGQYEVLLFPTWEREPFGFTVGEAAAAGCVSIMTAGIGASEWFISDIECMKIARTADALASAMYRWMSMAPDERLRMRRAAMKSARRYLPFTRWLEVIEQACTEKMNTGDPGRWAHSRGVQSAFLFLNQLWQESLA